MTIGESRKVPYFSGPVSEAARMYNCSDQRPR
jgi:hypothetical protein